MIRRRSRRFSIRSPVAAWRAEPAMKRRAGLAGACHVTRSTVDRPVRGGGAVGLLGLRILFGRGVGRDREPRRHASILRIYSRRRAPDRAAGGLALLSGAR